MSFGQSRGAEVPGVFGPGVRKSVYISVMAPRETKLDLEQFSKFLSSNETWQSLDDKKLTKEFKFPDFAGALAFVVKIGGEAERSNHHPDIELGWGRVRVTWTTHDAGGITGLDLAMAAKTDALFE
ncbi:MAG: 4a-hydroxytetrahydrobiopterin dehydratase [Polyangiaceae bacterium]